MSFDWKGKRAAVTGAASGIGRAIANAFAQAGAEVFVLDLNQESATAAANEIHAKTGSAVTAVAIDVSDEASVSAAFARFASERLDILVNSAGIAHIGTVASTPAADFDRLYRVNVRGTFFAAREAAKRMIAAGIPGRILNIASIASHTVLPGLSAYCGSKAAVAMLTRSLAREWARRNIAVNALCPGYIETAINDRWWPTEGGQKQLKGFPRRRLMDASDLDEAFLMLVGPSTKAMTGTVITVDDGQSLPG